MFPSLMAGFLFTLFVESYLMVFTFRATPFKNRMQETNQCVHIFLQKTDILTTSQGEPVGFKTAIQTVGPRGPALLQDFVFQDEMAHFGRERIPERVVHAKGAGLFLALQALNLNLYYVVVPINCDTSTRQTIVTKPSMLVMYQWQNLQWTKKQLRFYVACHSYTATYHISAILALGAHGYFEVTHDITRYCKAKLFESIGKKTPLFIRFSTVGECNNHKCTWVFSCD